MSDEKYPFNFPPPWALDQLFRNTDSTRPQWSKDNLFSLYDETQCFDVDAIEECREIPEHSDKIKYYEVEPSTPPSVSAKRDIDIPVPDYQSLDNRWESVEPLEVSPTSVVEVDEEIDWKSRKETGGPGGGRAGGAENCSGTFLSSRNGNGSSSDTDFETCLMKNLMAGGTSANQEKGVANVSMKNVAVDLFGSAIPAQPCRNGTCAVAVDHLSRAMGTNVTASSTINDQFFASSVSNHYHFNSMSNAGHEGLALPDVDQGIPFHSDMVLGKEMDTAVSTRSACIPITSPASVDQPHTGVGELEASVEQKVALMTRPSARQRFSDGAPPSKYCHVCGRRSASVRKVPCCYTEQNLCRKVVCEICIRRHDAEYSTTAVRLNLPWTCMHCRGACPPTARCSQYDRNNERRRMKKRMKLDRMKEGPE